ncbi:hypothetical protein B2G71_18705 [Novosphingobium sp. PC22D]|uniref:GNAT family N-acetyltransferase n=1 Tax=Novosphingobium sp. PC22D TaxID=1962403 RepID=UPI000BEF3CF0|nr:GNAT family N-acetyltransferase [Novosphingobium sp. PC22D]PEQ11074.1 hypothetical protein B2G71_18705 [Novosphingobium sp. PC22D]
MQRYEDAVSRNDVLRTARLVLRRPERSDIPAIVAIANDFEVASRVARVPHPYTVADAEFFLDNVVPPDLVWAILSGERHRLVGMIGLHLDRRTRAADLGYYIARPFWGQGFATEAAAAVIAYGIGLGCPGMITADYFIDNFASGRVLRKLGFVEAGVQAQHCLATGTARQCIRMELPA